MKRLYQKSVYGLYDTEIDRLVKESPVLSGSAKTLGIGINLGDKKGIESYITTLKGSQDGRYYRLEDSSWLPAIIPTLKSELKQLEIKFNKAQEARAKEGKRKLENDLKNWPPELFERRILCEAKLTVSEAELVEAEFRLEQLNKKVEDVSDSHILQYGPRGNGRLSNGTLVEIDGMRVIEIKDRLILDNGPYAGMDVADYRDIVADFKADLRKRDQEKLERLQAQAKQHGQPIPKSLPVHAMTRVSQNSLAKWPDSVRNWKKDPEKHEVKKTKVTTK